MKYIGIDIGSTASKTVVLDDEEKIIHTFLNPTGWNSKETAYEILDQITQAGINPEQSQIAATGYGRISVPFANETFSEITCHGLGGGFLFGNDATVIDIGGQDTKIITLKKGRVRDFLMNDKCSAGTGKFLEIMANRLGLSIPELLDLARDGDSIEISSMCTVFAESEVIGYIGKGESRENIARGIVESIITKVEQLVRRHGYGEKCYLTGGLCESELIIELLSERLGTPVKSSPIARYAGALGAALMIKKKYDKKN